MGLLRSERMRSGVIVLPAENAHQCVNAIGANLNVQFQDMHAHEFAPSRPYKRFVQRLDELERIVRFLHDEMERLPGAIIVRNNVEGFLETEKSYQFETVEQSLKQFYKKYLEFKSNDEKLVEAKNIAIEEKFVLQFALKLTVERQSKRAEVEDPMNPSPTRLEEALLTKDSMMFSNITGVIAQTEQERFARFLFRATRGNTYTYLEGIPELLIDPKTGKEQRKTVFVVYYQDGGDESSRAMHSRIVRACQQFGVNTYQWPTSLGQAGAKLEEITLALEDRNHALNAYEQFMLSESQRLLEVQKGGNSLLEEYRLFCMKEKSLYITLNYFEGERATLRAAVWYPEEDEEKIREFLKSDRCGSQNAMLIPDVTNKGAAPTYFKSSEFLVAFQDVINTYGFPRYGEASPVLFSIITFPFIFGIMYGDVGHGTLLFLSGLWCCYNADSIRYTLPGVYYARYMITLMGFFAVYSGFLYNDFFSLGLELFESRWKVPYKWDDENSYTMEPLYNVKNAENGGPGPYPFGIDPAWHGATNELLYMNSLKMKISVVVGVMQMIIGVLLRWSNAIHERCWLDLFCECFPMSVFMICYFGYMDFMILFKWVTPLDNPPSLINSLICMSMGQQDTAPLWDGAIEFAQMMMTFAIIAVPWLLLPKPIILILQNSRKKTQITEVSTTMADTGETVAGPSDIEEQKPQAHGEVFDVGECIIHQTIETIEYVLGTVSHTASYLRQWALSLAHQQLSMVFFQKTMQIALPMAYPYSVLGVFFAFFIWLMITLAVLMGMDVLECFLHTLRLHWVEFQSKFYRADGFPFLPYSHYNLLTAESN